MAVDKSRSPYFDDYDPQKIFHEILFVPARAVQTRELNQIQSMFQQQISRFGNHIFEDGSMVIPGEINYDLELEYVTLSIANYEAVSALLIGGELTISDITGTTAEVKLVSHPEGSDPLTFYLQYGNSATNDSKVRFQAGDELTITDALGNDIAEGTVIANGIGSKFTINDGVYYINGRFVLVQQQTVLLDKYSNNPSKVVCIEYDEYIVTENEDNSLFDNAQGTPNFTAPGAHRLAVDTRLAVYDLSDIDNLPEDSVEIFRINEGRIQRYVDMPEYSVLNDVLARRTYEESGDYTVKSFNVSFRENATDDTKFNAGMEAGLAYVKGYRVETLDTVNVPIDKARSTDIINNSSFSASLGNYIVVEGLNILPNVATLQTISFYDATISTPGVQPSGTLLGTARVRFVREDGSNHRLYLFDVRNAAGTRNTGFVKDARSIHSSDGQAVSADIVLDNGEAELKDAANNYLIYPLGVQFAKTIKNSQGVTDTSYSTVKQYTTTTDSNGLVTLSSSTNEVFTSQESTYAMATFTDTGEFFDVSSNFSLSGNPIGTVITIDFGSANAGRAVRINVQSAKQQVAQKTKTIQTETASGSLDGNNRLYLGKADAYEIVSVIDDNSDDVTNQFQIFDNATLSFYDESYVTGPSTGVQYPVTVTFKYFQHSAGDYFGPDSYVDLDYEDVPKIDNVRLTDTIDFRPRIADSGSSFTGPGSVVGDIPVPYTLVGTDVEHYLPRMDKLYVDINGNFGVVQGVPSLTPALPEDPSDAMVLYELEVPAYTFDIGDINALKVNNRRYTMKDIGRLETRLSNVEYYVSLTLLDQEAESKQVLDPDTGLNRFKNGFLTDSFIDHSVGDFGWENYHVSMDDSAGAMRPEFSLNAFDLEMNDADSSNVVNNGGIVTLPFESVSFIRQNMRSNTINVNPYAIFKWEGDTKLSPSVDSWIDTVYANPDVTYRVFNNGKLTQSWNSWQLNWTGGTTSTSSSTSSSRTATSTSTSTGSSSGFQFGRWTTSNSRTTTSTTTRFTTTTTTNTTTRTNIDVVNDKIIDTSVIPYMRSIEVTINGVGHRPETRMYFFFDGIDVNQYVKPSGGSYGNSVRTDTDGNFTAVFKIPNNDNDRFRTGEKKLAVTDVSSGKREDSTSWSEAKFTSSGIRRTRQQTIIATRSTTTSTSTRTTSEVIDVDVDRRTWRDPLAQSFLVESEGGVFVTKIDVFFAKKDKSVPVNIEIREMENGAPTQRIIPGAKKTLNPSQVPVSSDGSVATTFEFDYPIYLVDGTEYCFVVWTNSNNYECFYSKMGEKDLGTGRYIVEQPYAGVLFKSQNNSTWTADQTGDLQFHIWSAEFDTNVTGELIVNNSALENIVLPVNPLETTESSSQVRVYRTGHNYIEGGFVELSGAISGNGILDTELNAVHEIVEVIDPNSFVIEVTSTATLSGFIGGDTVEISDTIQASLLNPNIPTMKLTKTDITFEAMGTAGRSIDGTETPYQPMTEFVTMSNEDINAINQPWVVTSPIDEQQSLGGQKSFTMRMTLTSDRANLSPVVDMEGNSIISPFMLITKPDTIETDGSNNFANYRTQIAGLSNAANSIKVYLDADKPQGSELIVTARFGNSEEELLESDWIQLDDIVAQTSGSSQGLLENEYGLDDIDPYTLYQVMIQMKSDSAVRVPTCARLRILALGT